MFLRPQQPDTRNGHIGIAVQIPKFDAIHARVAAQVALVVLRANPPVPRAAIFVRLFRVVVCDIGDTISGNQSNAMPQFVLERKRRWERQIRLWIFEVDADRRPIDDGTRQRLRFAHDA